MLSVNSKLENLSQQPCSHVLLDCSFCFCCIIFLLGGNNSASLMAGLSGTIVEIVSGLYFWMYRETSKQLGKYHKRLEATEKYLIALQIIEMLPEGNRNEHMEN